jgi:predicted ATPase
MIREVSLRRFKQFASLDVKLPGHVVLAGPNNGGKTTLLQAIAAWDLAFRRWREINNTARRGGTYAFASIARPEFTAVPLPRNALDMLWTGRDAAKDIQISLRADGWKLAMELRFDQEQVHVRPTATTHLDDIEAVDLQTVYVPPMGGLAPDEPVYGDKAFLIGRFAEGRPGEVLRNLLLEASSDQRVWARLNGAVYELFGCDLELPQRGQYLRANYRAGGGPELDLMTAGSGFQQVLLLMSVLVLRPGSVLLLDEPDAHLHVILQGSTYRRLQRIAGESNAQLVVSTHSEVIIDATDATQVVAMPAGRPIVDEAERDALVRGLRLFSNTDVLLAQSVPGILYVEGHTDIQLLVAWARVLGHPALDVLTKQLYWHRYSTEGQANIASFQAKDHYEALRVHAPRLAALELLDSDGNKRLPVTTVTGSGFQRLHWARYEVESYLLHPEALRRFVRAVTVPASPDTAEEDLLLKMIELLTSEFVSNPGQPTKPAQAVLEKYKARTELLPPILEAGGLPAFPYTRFHEIAAQMLPAEIDVEVKEKLDAICVAFGIPLQPPVAPATPNPGTTP